MDESLSPVVSVLLGISLSAATGFRVFVPLLIMSIASLFGYLELSPGFTWIGTVPALIVFAAATVAEVAGYFIPFVDNMLDTIATPLAVVAGIVVAASVIVEIDPFLKWILAIIAGGATAGIVQGITALLRLASTGTTVGMGNASLAMTEVVSSAGLSLIALFVPIVAIVIVAGVLYVAIVRFRRMQRKTSIRA